MQKAFHIIWLDSIDSTNSELKRNIDRYAGFTVLSARDQTAGRGQRGNTWYTSPGENLTFSILLRPGKDGIPAIVARDEFIISKAATLAVCDFLQGLGLAPAIKWPNDIYIRNRKICGMLIENTICGRTAEDGRNGTAGRKDDILSVESSIVGIGININQTNFAPCLVNPTSAALLTGRHYNLDECLESFLDIFSRYTALLSSGPVLSELYKNRLWQLGEARQYHDNLTGRTFTGIIQGVSPSGRLILTTPGGTAQDYGFKEISYII